MYVYIIKTEIEFLYTDEITGDRIFDIYEDEINKAFDAFSASFEENGKLSYEFLGGTEEEHEFCKAHNIHDGVQINFIAENDLRKGEVKRLKEHLVKYLCGSERELKKKNIVSSVVSVKSKRFKKDENKWGSCAACGARTSDWREKHTAAWRGEHFLSNGARIDGKWYCDLCLPEEHINHF
ncbi:MAG: hypothetical protein LBT20_01385 [Clostridiales bacterium]|jgi:hypothetical protein|nr:hypothetical protein [Clostridiales bacterium]